MMAAVLHGLARVLLRVLVEVSLTAGCTEVIGLPHILRLTRSRLGIYVHTTDRVFLHGALTSFQANYLSIVSLRLGCRNRRAALQGNVTGHAAVLVYLP